MIQIHHWTEVLDVIENQPLIYKNGENKEMKVKQMIAIYILVTTIFRLHTVHKELQDNRSHPKGNLNTDPCIDYLPDKVKTRIRSDIASTVHLTPHFERTVRLMEIKDLRNKEMLPALNTDYSNLTEKEIALFKVTWDNLNMIKIDNKKLNVKPFRREHP